MEEQDGKKQQDIETNFKQEREELEKKEKLTEEEDEKLQFFIQCNQQKIHLSDVLCYKKEDLIELGFEKKGTRDRLLAWIAQKARAAAGQGEEDQDPKKLTCPNCVPPMQANRPFGDFTTNRPNSGDDDGNENVNLDHLTMLECIHKSSRGEVWQCKDQKGRQFIAKMVAKPFLGDIEAAMLTVTANQKHVVKLLNHTVSPTAGPTVLLLEFLPGELYIPTTQAEIASYFESLIEALHHLHRLGVVHNDVKPDNIMWEGGPNGRGVVIIDFGSANLYPPGSSWIPRTNLYVTRGFAAPELLAVKPCSHNVDIWSVGVMLFMMILGIVPMDDGETVQAASQLSFSEVIEWADKQNRYSYEERAELLTLKRWHLIQKMLTRDKAVRPSAAALHANFKSWYW